MCSNLMVMILISLIFFSANVHSKPFSPENEEMVLLNVSTGMGREESEKIQKLKKLLKQNNNQSEIAVNLATVYIKTAIEKNDPRYYGLAESVIKPWWSNDNNPKIMMLKARIFQFNHQFADAIEVLNKLVGYRSNAQALLMRASINQVVGDYQKTKNDCGRMALKTNSLIAAACHFSVKGITSSPEKTRILISHLVSMLDNSPRESVGVQLWVIGLLAESASLMGDQDNAEILMVRGLNLKSDDVYLLGLYADLLLKQNRFQACVELLEAHSVQTSLFVRYLTAKNQVSATNVKSLQQNELDLRIREDLIKGDERHFREYAYYQFYVENKYNDALQHAQINWQNQKEISDLLILYRIAKKMQRSDILQTLSTWSASRNITVNYSEQALKI